jgi:UPF0271 protein
VSIDLNADVGEGMDDASLLPWVTSVNVACGYHAGDAGTMDRTVSLALGRGVRVGAHPGYPDRESFGRARFEMAPEEIENMVLYQVSALDGIVRSRGGTLTHVKPHGALYHRGAESGEVGRAIARGVQRCRAGLILVGPAGSRVMDVGREVGLTVAGEAFADRRYRPDGTLVSREHQGALLTDPDEAAEQAVSIARDGRVTASDGSTLTIRADTICLHGDTPGAPAIAKRVHERLREEGIRMAPLEAARSEGRAIPTIPPG